MKKTFLTMVGALALFGCGGGGGGGGSSSGVAHVAFVDAAADGTALDFSLDGRQKASVAAYVQPSFQNVSAGTYAVSFGAAGAVSDLVSESRGLTDDTDVLVVAAGLLTPPDDDGTPPAPQAAKGLQLFTGTVDRSVLNGTKARVIVVDALVTAANPPIGAIDLRNPTDPILATSFTNVPFGASAPAGNFASKEIDPGTYSYQARLAGTDQILVPTKSLTFVAGKVYLVLVTGTEGGAGAQAPDIRQIEIPTRK